jgi:hypothetical protein
MHRDECVAGLDFRVFRDKENGICWVEQDAKTQLKKQVGEMMNCCRIAYCVNSGQGLRLAELSVLL